MLAGWINSLRTGLSHSPFTVTGRLLALSAAFCLFAIVEATLISLLSYVFWLVLFGFGLGMLYRPRLKVKVRWVPLVTNGHSFPVQIEVKNIGRLGGYDLQCTLELPSAGLRGIRLTQSISAIAPGETMTIDFMVKAERRGVFELSKLAVASLFPLSFFRFLTLHPLKYPITVIPSYEQEQGMVGEIVEGLDVDHVAGRSKKNSLLEYIGSREFRPGVPVRRWDFASWARLATPSVREFSEGSDTVVAVVVDAARRRASKSRAETLEAVLSIAAGIIAQLDSTQQSMFLVIIGKDIQFTDGRVVANQRDELMTRLATVEDEAAGVEWFLAWDRILSELPADATIACIVSDEQAAASMRDVDCGARNLIVRCAEPRVAMKTN